MFKDMSILLKLSEFVKNRPFYNNCNIQHLIVYNNYMYILVIKSDNNFDFDLEMPVQSNNT